jgi:prevent-host-death family protein
VDVSHDILVSMTRIEKTPPAKKSARPPGSWSLQNAKARFSELVRRARSEGPQRVTVHGRDEVVIVSEEEFRRLAGERTGAELIAALQASPYRDLDIEPRRERLPVRDVKL